MSRLYILYTDISAIILAAILTGIGIAYMRIVDSTYPLKLLVILSMLYVASKIIIFLRTREFLWQRMVIITILILGSSCLGYILTERSVMNYYELQPFYAKQEGQYVIATTKDSELVSFSDGAYQKITGRLYGVIAEKNHKEWHIVGKGLINTYSKLETNTQKKDMVKNETHPNLMQAGSLIMVKGTPTIYRPIKEVGSIDLTARAISSGTVATIYNGDYQYISEEMLSSYGFHESFIDRMVRNIYSITSYFRYRISAYIHTYLPEEERTICKSLILGANYHDLSPLIIDTFSYSGLIHILSVSGSHIALLFSFVYGSLALFRVPKRKSVYAALLVVIGYCILLGFNAPAVRASIMGVIIGMSVIMGRRYNARQALLNTAIVLLIYNPLLALDISFQFSFLSTLGIILFFRPMYILLPRIPSYLKGPIILSLTAQSIILPLQLYYFHFFSPISVVTAVIVTPLLDVVIILLLLVLVLSIVISVPILWYVIKWILQLALFFNYSLVQWKFSVIWVGMLPLLYSVIYYMGIRFLYYYVAEVSVVMYHYVIYVISIIGITFIFALGMNYYSSHLRFHYIPIKRGIAYTIVQGYHNRMLYIDMKNNPIDMADIRMLRKAIQGQGFSSYTMIIGEHVEKCDREQLTMLCNRSIDMDSSRSFYRQDTYRISSSSNNKVPHNSNQNQLYIVGDWKPYSGGELEIEKSNDKLLAIHVSNSHGNYYFTHGQIDKKALELNNKVNVFITDTPKIIDSEIVNNSTVIYYATGYKKVDVDIDNDYIYTAKYRYIPDVTL